MFVPALEWNKPQKSMWHIYYNEINLVIEIVKWCVNMSTDKKSFLQIPKELSECNAMANRKRKK